MWNERVCRCGGSEHRISVVVGLLVEELRSPLELSGASCRNLAGLVEGRRRIGLMIRKDTASAVSESRFVSESGEEGSKSSRERLSIFVGEERVMAG